MVEHQIADLAKNGRERVRITLTEFKGSRFVDLRTFATNRDAALVPTPKGIGIRPTMLRETIAALMEAERILIADGTLKGGAR